MHFGSLNWIKEHEICRFVYSIKFSKSYVVNIAMLVTIRSVQVFFSINRSRFWTFDTVSLSHSFNKKHGVTGVTDIVL